MWQILFSVKELHESLNNLFANFITQTMSVKTSFNKSTQLPHSFCFQSKILIFFLLTSQFVFISFMNTSHNKKFCRRIARKYKKKIKGRLTQYVSEHDEILNRWKNKLGHFSFSIHTSRAVSSSRTSLLIIDFIDLRKNKHEEPPSDDILF